MARDRIPDHRPRRRTLAPDEVRIWRAVVRDVVPLPDRAPVVEDVPEPAMSPPPASLPAPPLSVPPPRRDLPALAHGRMPGLDRRSAERLKRGEMPIDGRLDLHGMTQDLAHAALTAFIGRAFETGKRCLLVITGKGTREGSGVLRANVPRWLNQPPLRERILGFTYARPQHGGEGALYVLVRQRRP